MYIIFSLACYKHNALLEKEFPINKKSNQVMDKYLLKLITFLSVVISNYLPHVTQKETLLVFYLFMLYTVVQFAIVLVTRLILNMFIKDGIKE